MPSNSQNLLLKNIRKGKITILRTIEGALLYSNLTAQNLYDETMGALSFVNILPG